VDQPPPSRNSGSAQRGLLAVGVVFVVLAAGFLLKLSFDRGWISPLVRCTGGAVAGFGLGALGWRLHGRGVRVYGAALIGAGAAIVYLAVWAAAQLYALLPPYPALTALALVSVGLSAVALAINQQSLGASAVLGGLFAPMLVRAEPASMNLLLAYLASVGGGLGAVAAIRGGGWPSASPSVHLRTPSAAAPRCLAPGFYSHAIAPARLVYGTDLRWAESRMVAFAGGWTCFAASGIAIDRWPTAVGAALPAVPVCWRAYRAPVWPTALWEHPRRNRSLLFDADPPRRGTDESPRLPTRHGGLSRRWSAAYRPCLRSGLASFRTVAALAIGSRPFSGKAPSPCRCC
jgi:hypothetical protein